MCNDDFFLFPKKLCSDKCPACTQKIISYIALTPKEWTRQSASDEEAKDFNFESEIEQFYNTSDVMDFQELLKAEGDPNARKLSNESDETAFDCLDHEFFNVELKSLINMHKQTEQAFWKRGQMTFREQQALDQIYDRAIDLQFAIQQFHQFDPNVMIVQVQDLTEQLCKISSGKFEECPQNDEVFDQTNQDQFPDWDDGFFASEKGRKP